MMPELPPCTEFIIAAVRKLRLRPRNSTSSWVGLQLKSIYSRVRQLYTNAEFARSLTALIQSGELTIIARMEGGPVVNRITEIPECESYDRWTNQDKKQFYRTRAYITADGLPRNILQQLGEHPRSKVTAYDILESMQKK